MKMIVLFCIIFTNILLPDQINVDPSQHIRAKKVESQCTGISYVQGSKDVSLIFDVPCTTGQFSGIEIHSTFSAYQFSLSSIPQGAYNITEPYPI